MDHAEAQQSRAVEKYLLEELTPNEREEFELHFFLCPECAEELRIGTLFEENARAVFREGYTPAKWWHGLAQVWRRPAFAAPAFATLLLLAFSGYQNTVEIPGLRAKLARVEQPQVAWLIPLHGLTRGMETLTEVPSGATSLTLQFDVNAGKVPSRILCEVQDSSGKLMSSVTAAVPADSTVRLNVPTALLTPGAWQLVVRDPASRTEVSRYSFTYRFK